MSDLENTSEIPLEERTISDLSLWGKPQLIGLAVGAAGMALPYIIDPSYSLREVNVPGLGLAHGVAVLTFGISLINLGITRVDDSAALVNTIVRSARRSVQLYSDSLDFDVYGQGSPSATELFLKKAGKGIPVNVVVQHDPDSRTLEYIQKCLDDREDRDYVLSNFELSQLKNPRVARSEEHFMVVDNTRVGIGRNSGNGTEKFDRQIRYSSYVESLLREDFGYLRERTKLVELSS